MRRRDFLTLAGATAAAWPLESRAQQQPPAMRRLGFIFTLTADDVATPKYLEALRRGLASQGWVEGKNLLIDYRFGSTGIAAARLNAQQLIDLKPDVLVSVGGNNAIALTDATKTIPIVFGQVTDVVGRQLVPDLPHPTGNATGFFNKDDTTISGKWIELLKELRPDVQRVALLYDPAAGAGYRAALEAGAASLGVQPEYLDYTSVPDVVTAVADFAKQPKSGLVTAGGGVVFTVRQQLYLAVAAAHLPVVWGHILFAIDGAPVVYTIDSLKQVQGGGEYAARVLNGEKVANLPAQLPLTYSLIINLKNARAQGLSIPQSLLIRADQVVE